VRASGDIGDAEIRISPARDLTQRGVLDRRRCARGLSRSFALHVSP
jgi:hypothetical protein